MPSPTLSGWASILGVLAVIALLAGGAWYFLHARPAAVACTMEAKICPDGSSVGRVPPSCEFAACPEASGVDTSGWLATTTSGTTIKYPKDFGTTYISTVDWPPSLQITSDAFTCTPAGAETARAGMTESRTIGGREYCVTKESEGAAGSTYTNYAYAFARGSGTAILTFTLRAPQCGNYDDPKKTECQNEESAFDPDAIVDAIARSLLGLHELSGAAFL